MDRIQNKTDEFGITTPDRIFNEDETWIHWSEPLLHQYVPQAKRGETPKGEISCRFMAMAWVNWFRGNDSIVPDT